MSARDDSPGPSDPRAGNPPAASRDLRERLTGLPGLGAVRERIEAWQAQDGFMPQGAAVHAMLISLRRLDAVKIAYGESAGDDALEEIAGRIAQFASSELEGPWTIARAAGGAFLLVANEACSLDRWQLFADQLAEGIARPIAVPGGILRLSPRLVLVRLAPHEAIASMLDRLGHALAESHDPRAGRIAWAGGGTASAGRSAAQLEADLLGAIDRDEIEILFQPQFSLVDDSLTGAEALARWNHPEVGRIGAAALFAIAERCDHVGPLSRHIAGKALALACDWPRPLRLSINVTPADLAFGSYVRQMLDIVEETGFPPGQLTLEVTEQALIFDVELAARIMGEFAARGIHIALDDFGAGFCNFRYLKVLPLHAIKLDRSMIEGVTSDERDLAVLRAIVAMASALGLEVIAEGVESEAQRELVAREHCAYYQGFLRAQPMSAGMFDMLAGF